MSNTGDIATKIADKTIFKRNPQTYQVEMLNNKQTRYYIRNNYVEGISNFVSDLENKGWQIDSIKNAALLTIYDRLSNKKQDKSENEDGKGKEEEDGDGKGKEEGKGKGEEKKDEGKEEGKEEEEKKEEGKGEGKEEGKENKLEQQKAVKLLSEHLTKKKFMALPVTIVVSKIIDDTTNKKKTFIVKDESQLMPPPGSGIEISK